MMILGLLSKVQPDPASGYAIINSGVFSATHGEFGSAIEYWRGELRADPNNTMALNNIAWIQATCLDEAFRDGTNAVALATKACDLIEWKSWVVLETLAAAYAELGDFENAIKSTERAIGLEGTPGSNRQKLFERLEEFRANTPLRDGPRNALESYSKPIENQPTDAIKWLARGSYWHEKGDIDNAISDFNEAIRLDPSIASAYEKRGAALELRGDTEAAIDDLTMAIRLKPQRSAPYSRRGTLFRKKGEFGNAVLDFLEAINLGLNDGSVHCYLSFIWASCPDDQFRDGTKAVEYATKACELSGWGYWVPINALAAAHAESGHFASAIEWAEKAMELVPEQDRQIVEERLESYRANRPYRQR
jgi:tetratricopeptide (TPR) repeat protein